MRKLLFLLIICLLISITESKLRRPRRQYNPYSFVQQYGDQYGIYGPGGQGWVNKYNDRYPHHNYAWNTNFNWNQGHRLPEWYFNSGKMLKPSMIVFTVFCIWGCFSFCI